MSEFDRYISVDIETAGPNPGEFSLLAIGACLVIDPEQGFYIELQPVNDRITDESHAVHGLDLDALAANGQPPASAMEKFADWLAQTVPAGRPIFVAFNAPFDWMFICDYFHRYLGRNPFGHSALDIKAFYMGRYGVPWSATSMNQVTETVMGHRTLSHHALQDARDQAEIFRQLLPGG